MSFTVNTPNVPKTPKNGGNKSKKPIVTLVLLALLAILVFSSFTIVPAGHTGVRVTMGRVSGTVGEGLAFRPPFIQNIVIMDNRTVALEIRTESVTRDLQSVQMEYTVNYRLNQDMSDTVFRTVGTGFQSIIISPTVEETVKDITARYTIEELITDRARVSTDIAAALGEALSGRGFTFERFNIVDFSFSPEFSNAIEQVRIAEQNALRAEQDLRRVEFEAEQEIARAEAQAEVLRLQAQELTDTNLAAMWIDAWDGVLPRVMTDDSGMFFNFSLGDFDTHTPATTTPAPAPAATADAD